MFGRLEVWLFGREGRAPARPRLGGSGTGSRLRPTANYNKIRKRGQTSILEFIVIFGRRNPAPVPKEKRNPFRFAYNRIPPVFFGMFVALGDRNVDMYSPKMVYIWP